MSRKDKIDLAAYNPNKLMTEMIRVMGVKNDAALAAALEIGPPVISKIRHGGLIIGRDMLLRLQDATGVEANSLRKIAGLAEVKPVIAQRL